MGSVAEVATLGGAEYALAAEANDLAAPVRGSALMVAGPRKVGEAEGAAVASGDGGLANTKSAPLSSSRF